MVVYMPFQHSFIPLAAATYTGASAFALHTVTTWHNKVQIYNNYAFHEICLHVT